MPIYPVTEGDCKFLKLLARSMSCSAKFLPSTAILNLLPDFLECVLQLNEFLLEPLDLFRNLHLFAEFVELLGKFRDDCLGRGEIAELETLEVVGDRSLSSVQLSLELVTDRLTKGMDLVLSLLDCILDRLECGDELLPDYRVLDSFLDKAELR